MWETFMSSLDVIPETRLILTNITDTLLPLSCLGFICHQVKLVMRNTALLEKAYGGGFGDETVPSQNFHLCTGRIAQKFNNGLLWIMLRHVLSCSFFPAACL